MNAELVSLVAQLEGIDTAAQTAAAMKLAGMGAAAQPAIVALVRTVGIPEEEVLEACTAALEEVGPPAADQIAPLAALAGDCSADIAYWAATLLGRAKETAAPAVAALTAVLDGGADLPVRERAAWALGEIGPAAQAARPALTTAAAGPDVRLARLAKKAIEAIGG